MKEVINKEEAEKLKWYSIVLTVLYAMLIVSAIPLSLWLGFWSLIPYGILWATAMYFAFRAERIKKDNDIQTYKEILAFTEGKRLDDIQKQREIGKRPYQKFLLVVGSAVVAVAGCLIIGLLMHVILN